MDWMVKMLLRALAVLFALMALMLVLVAVATDGWAFLAAVMVGLMAYGLWRWSNRSATAVPREKTMEERLRVRTAADPQVEDRGLPVASVNPFAARLPIPLSDLPIETFVPAARPVAAPAVVSGETVAAQSIPGGVVLNPAGRLPITLNGLTLAQFTPVALALNNRTYIPEVKAQLALLLAAYNATSPEIDRFIGEVARKYQVQRKELLAQQVGYETWTAADQEDLMEEVAEEAVSNLGLCIEWDDIGVLLNEKPEDMTADDAITARFIDDPGLMQNYLGMVSSGKVRQPYDADDRKRLEKLVAMGLAVNGAALPLEKVLGAMLLKDIKALIEDVAPKKFTRKADAITFAMSLPDLVERIGKVLPLRASYYCPMPEDGNTEAAIQAMSYAGEYAGLIVSTLITEARTRRALQEPEVKKWRVENSNVETCPYCVAHVDKVITARAKVALPPHHFGCSCGLDPEFD